MSVESFIPELWDAAIQEPFEKNLVFTQPTVANRKYEGELKQKGDKVHIQKIGTPKVKKYNKTQGIDVDELETTVTDLTVDQNDYWAFRVHDVDKAQTAGDFQGPAAEAAAIGIRDECDKHAAKEISKAAKAKLGQLTVVNDEPSKAGDGQITAYKALVKLSTALNSESVPTTGRYVVIGPKTHAALLMDPRFTRVDASGTSEGLRNGIVGRAVGFDVLISNNIPSTSGRELVIAGVPQAFSFVEQLVETEALRSQTHFGDIVRGMILYGCAVTRPEGLATADLDVVDPS